ncbi:MAG: hypothetical protein CL609_18630 [Anaerolineaceae bacterium]|nr:hypothetical protein [Anaerolineaceae bacterium]
MQTICFAEKWVLQKGSYVDHNPEDGEIWRSRESNKAQLLRHSFKIKVITWDILWVWLDLLGKAGLLSGKSRSPTLPKTASLFPQPVLVCVLTLTLSFKSRASAATIPRLGRYPKPGFLVREYLLCLRAWFLLRCLSKEQARILIL